MSGNVRLARTRETRNKVMSYIKYNGTGDRDPGNNR